MRWGGDPLTCWHCSLIGRCRAHLLCRQQRQQRKPGTGQLRQGASLMQLALLGGLGQASHSWRPGSTPSCAVPHSSVQCCKHPCPDAACWRFHLKAPPGAPPLLRLRPESMVRWDAPQGQHGGRTAGTSAVNGEERRSPQVSHRLQGIQDLLRHFPRAAQPARCTAERSRGRR